MINKALVVILGIASVIDLGLSFTGVKDPYLYASIGILEGLLALHIWDNSK